MVKQQHRLRKLNGQNKSHYPCEGSSFSVKAGGLSVPACSGARLDRRLDDNLSGECTSSIA